MDDVVLVVPLHNSSREKRVLKLFSFAWVNYEASVIVPYITVYGVARFYTKFLSVLQRISLPGFCCFANLSVGMASTRLSTTLKKRINRSCFNRSCFLLSWSSGSLSLLRSLFRSLVSVCISVCVCPCPRACASVRTCVHLSLVSECTRSNVCASEYLFVFVCVCVCVCVPIWHVTSCVCIRPYVRYCTNIEAVYM